ncbi:hypothetical protein V6N13_104933 [Hibiscus sabdariffa]|uniref:VQ domain-containing protein n=1 Tax=Hibiscus sabdariffa TaxID=183260 RepID=A0ABR2SJ60_9ROSI
MASSSKTTVHHHSPPPPDATTTFVQAEPSTFRTIVQRLTGAFHERRETIKKLEINLNSNNNGKKGSQFVRQRGSLVSPVSTLDFLRPSSNANRTRSIVEGEEEEEEGFYLPGPGAGAGPGAEPEPELLPLFPLRSPRENMH